MKAVTTLRAVDPENKTDQVPVCFVLHALLHLDRDFGVVKIRNTEDDRMDKLVTITAWKGKYAVSLDATSVEEMCRRMASLVGYVKDQGVVKCHALTNREVDLIAAGVAAAKRSRRPPTKVADCLAWCYQRTIH